MSRRVSKAEQQTESDDARTIPGALPPRPESPSQAPDAKLQTRVVSQQKILDALLADRLENSVVSVQAARLAQTPVFLTSFANKTLFMAMAFDEAWVAMLSDQQLQQLHSKIEPILKGVFGRDSSLEIDDGELFIHKADGRVENVGRLPRYASREVNEGGALREFNLGPIRLVAPASNVVEGEGKKFSPLLQFHPAETSINSLAEMTQRCEVFLALVRSYLVAAAEALKKPIPRASIVIDGEMLPPPQKAANPLAFMQQQSALSKADLARSLRAENIANVGFADVFGQEKAVEAMRHVAQQIGARAAMVEWGARLPTGILLVGPTGNGKTRLAAAAANEAGAAFLSADVSQLFRGLWGETEQRASWLVELARDAAKEHPSKACILFLDEVDAIASSRQHFGGGSTAHNALNIILSSLSGLTVDHSVVVVATTNLPDSLDAAFMNRMDRRIEVPAPDERARQEILRGQMQLIGKGLKRSPFGEVDCVRIAQLTESFSGRQLTALLNLAVAEKAVWQAQHRRRPQPVATDDLMVILAQRAEELSDYSSRVRPFRPG